MDLFAVRAANQFDSVRTEMKLIVRATCTTMIHSIGGESSYELAPRVCRYYSRIWSLRSMDNRRNPYSDWSRIVQSIHRFSQVWIRIHVHGVHGLLYCYQFSCIRHPCNQIGVIFCPVLAQISQPREFDHWCTVNAGENRFAMMMIITHFSHVYIFRL